MAMPRCFLAANTSLPRARSWLVITSVAVHRRQGLAAKQDTDLDRLHYLPYIPRAA